jgi:hypothetical protein
MTQGDILQASRPDKGGYTRRDILQAAYDPHSSQEARPLKKQERMIKLKPIIISLVSGQRGCNSEATYNALICFTIRYNSKGWVWPKPVASDKIWVALQGLERCGIMSIEFK